MQGFLTFSLGIEMEHCAEKGLNAAAFLLKMFCRNYSKKMAKVITI